MKLLKIFFLSLSFSAFLITPVLALTSTPQIPIPNPNPNDGGIDFSKEVDFSKYNSTQPIGEYIKYIMKYIIGICAILGTIMVMIGGFKYVMSGGDSGMIKDAQDTIFSAFIGIILAASSYIILATVNMDLVNFKATSVATIKILPNTCGVFDEKIGRCGDYCGLNTTCERASTNISGSKECHDSVGPDEFWICSPMVAGGSSCCTDDATCAEKHGTGFFCNKGITTPSCRGACMQPQGDNTPCDRDIECAPPYTCEAIDITAKRCKNIAGNPIGTPCRDDANCTSGSKCMGDTTLSDGICLVGSPGDSCCINSDCLSGICSNNTSFWTLCTAKRYYGDRCL